MGVLDAASKRIGFACFRVLCLFPFVFFKLPNIFIIPPSLLLSPEDPSCVSLALFRNGK